jgi:hypothetical protein
VSTTINSARWPLAVCSNTHGAILMDWLARYQPARAECSRSPMLVAHITAMPAAMSKKTQSRARNRDDPDVPLNERSWPREKRSCTQTAEVCQHLALSCRSVSSSVRRTLRSCPGQADYGVGRGIGVGRGLGVGVGLGAGAAGVAVGVAVPLGGGCCCWRRLSWRC